MAASALHVERIGHGSRIVCVHGSMGHGSEAFEALRDLADTFSIEFVDRRGFGRSAAREGRVDFELDAGDIVDLVGDGAHLIGHSYGGVVALVAAGRRPDLVRSITVIEPPLFSAAAGNANVGGLRSRLEPWYPAPGGMTTGRWLARFVGALGSPVPDELPVRPDEEADVRASMQERPPWEAVADLAAIRGAKVPVLVVRGDWAPDPAGGAAGGEAFRVIAEAIADATGGTLLVVPGATHGPQYERPDLVLPRLRAHLEHAEAAAR